MSCFPHSIEENRSMMSLRTLASTTVLLACLAVACASGPRPMDGFAAKDLSEEAPLGGEALAQRATDLSRALGDLRALGGTMASLIDRRDARGLAVFDEFVAEYMGTHLDPLLSPRWQSDHPEVMAVDANLRFLKADLLIQMRYPRRVQDVIDEIQVRYQGRENMLVEYPEGEQQPLGEALAQLRNRKWNG
jgi:hypothetical protein